MLDKEQYKRWKKEVLMQEAKTREQIFVEAFQGLSLAETVVKLRNLGVKTDVEEGFVVLHHPMLEPDYEKGYPDTLILIKGRKE